MANVYLVKYVECKVQRRNMRLRDLFSIFHACFYDFILFPSTANRHVNKNLMNSINQCRVCIRERIIERKPNNLSDRVLYNIMLH